MACLLSTALLSRHQAAGYHGMMDPVTRSRLVEQLARQAGFARVGIAGAEPPTRLDYFNEWLERGWAGDMNYLARHRELRSDPRGLLPGAQSIIVVAENYHQEWPEHSPVVREGQPRGGRVSQYAWGRDYHRVLRNKLHRLADSMHAEIAESFRTRVCVDTAPLIEREAAAAAGIGWIGKNTMVLHEGLGSFFFLGEILTTLQLAPSRPVTDRCGSCTRCLDACPTDALVEPYRMDARRCISYLTIEHRREIPESLQPLMGDWLYGCDICQDVCPYNRKAPLAQEAAYLASERHPLAPYPDLESLCGWDEEAYQSHLAGSAMRRATLDMLKRNARIVKLNLKVKKS